MTAAAGPGPQRTPARLKARQLARYLRAEWPDYAYLKDVFRYLRAELDIEVTRAPKKLPYIPPKPRSASPTTPSGSPPGERRHLDQDPPIYGVRVAEHDALL